MKKAGIINPGAMGVSVAATMVNSGYEVYWVAEGRSEASKQRAAEQNFKDAGSLAEMCANCEAIVSVCPPHAAEDVAEAVLAEGFSGLYLDGNAISPQKALRIAEKVQADGGDFVDGSIVGGPAWEPGRTWMYLSGERADDAAALFAAGPLETDIISDEPGKASALKMCFAANTKGSTALLSLVMAAAEELGVRDDLERQWGRYDDSAVERNQNRVRQVTRKAWRFVGEMNEMVETFEGIGLPGGFHGGAADLYTRIADFKDDEDLPELLDVLKALLTKK